MFIRRQDRLSIVRVRATRNTRTSRSAVDGSASIHVRIGGTDRTLPEIDEATSSKRANGFSNLKSDRTEARVVLSRPKGIETMRHDSYG